jgi:hypothetical protein
VSVVSTGTVKIHPEPPDGASKPLYWWLLTSRRWTPPPPINAYIIEHAKGLILREDHLGGLAELGGANLLVAAAERDQLSGFSPALRGLLRKHLTIPGVQWHQIGFEPTGASGLAPFTESLLIRRRQRSPLLQVGDLTDGAELLLLGGRSPAWVSADSWSRPPGRCSP